MDNTATSPPEEVSRKVLDAIRGALEEEKQPRSTRALKIALATLASTTVLAVPMALLLREQMSWAWKLAALIWTIFFGVGFSLHYYPQPRLKVPGYWSPWAFGRILIAMTLLTWIQILICPSFVFLESPISWSPFAGITESLMAWGGMKACMFGCGVLFSGIAGSVAFMTVRRVLIRSSRPHLLQAVGLAYLTQLPLIGIQIIDPSLRTFAGFWALGSVAGLLLVLGATKFSERLA